MAKAKAKAKSVGMLKIGKSYLFRTVTHYDVGKVVAVDDAFVMIDGASWIADTGRFADALASGNLLEVEPAGNGVLIACGAIVDVFPWNHALPTKQK